ncbi:SpoIID/LytB domain-containing protein [Anaeromyxobacter paludicola]|uniref:Sporulation stage II protein D amidase enhancer LytB N-terminal domain-containing protein n=1 Tax=Anaeromyxobacter paludicola TaxID=2918171 RepID=A0ABN6N4T3_9BACT|nr:SpoIID/LytB domain-containing protein [Anaeromyxobacter paludicola]BDG08202.1 hypothetical protein AMPC_13150 [Anaeromyxobacter paludicola]
MNARPRPLLVAALTAALLSAPAPREARAAEAEPAAAPAPPVGGQDAPPAPIPPPLPPPGSILPPLGPGDDPLDLLWAHRLNFAAGGAPLVTIRLLEGQDRVEFRPRDHASLAVRGGSPLHLAAGHRFEVRVVEALPAAVVHHPLLGEVALGDRAGLERARALWASRGVKLRERLVGSVFGIAGRVIDNRRTLLLAEGDGSERWAREFAERAFAEQGVRPAILDDVVTRPSGTLEVLDEAGQRLALADQLVELEVEGDRGFVLSRVEQERGKGPGREDRAYRGRLFVTVDASGRLAAVHGVALEELLRGLVPSEMPAGSPLEALKAQAVTARSNVLAQIGTRHLTDPWVLCSEVHCQAYRGEAAQTARTDEAVRATHGEALFGRADRALVDAVYSAVCGGHGEDNDAVWGNLPSASLRGRPDLPAAEADRWRGGLRDEARLRAFLDGAPRGWCARARGISQKRYRWERRFTRAELDRLAAPLGVGPVRALEVGARGVSGRALSLRIEGERGAATVQGELKIRRLLGNLMSAMFTVGWSGGEWVFRGGGWGHGAGMCQWGAVGRAEAGQGYREILRAYYSGAEVARIY